MKETTLARAGNLPVFRLVILILAAWPLAGDVNAQPAPTTHTIFMTAAEITGATTIEKLAPPPIDPGDLSKGYGFKPPGGADQTTPERWEVSSYLFTPGFVTVWQGDTVTLTVFVVNGDEHEVRLLAPNGKVIAAKTILNRGREYRLSFVAQQPGTYHLSCSIHAPTMTASIFVVPR